MKWWLHTDLDTATPVTVDTSTGGADDVPPTSTTPPPLLAATLGRTLAERHIITLPGTGAPGSVTPGPLFDWFPDRFADLPWIIPAGSLAADVPHKDMAPRSLQRFVLEDATYEQRDQIWAGLVTGCRDPGTAHAYRIIALGVAAKGLRGFRNSLIGADRTELLDIDADLAYGFLRRLPSIKLDASNIGGRLIASGTNYAKWHWGKYLDRPATVRPDPALSAGNDSADGDSSLQSAFATLIADLAATGRPLKPDDITLLAMTSLEGRTVIDAAEKLHRPLEAIYKRRQRLAARIRAHLQSNINDDSPSPATGRGATASAAEAAPSTHRTAAIPGPRRPTPTPTPTAQPASSDRDQPATPR